MKIGRVVGALWATKKVPELAGIPFLLVEPEGGGAVFAAADSVGAGPGERVLIAQGSAARLNERQPLDARIIGIIDAVESWKGDGNVGQ